MALLRLLFCRKCRKQTEQMFIYQKEVFVCTECGTERPDK